MLQHKDNRKSHTRIAVRDRTLRQWVRLIGTYKALRLGLEMEEAPVYHMTRKMTASL